MQIKNHLSLVALAFQFSLHAEVSLPKTGLNCEAQIKEVVAPWNPSPNWRLAQTTETTLTYLAATKQMGQWLEAKVTEKEMVLSLRNIKTVKTFKWAISNCALTSSERLVQYDPNKMKNNFTDEDMTKLLKKNTAGIIYAWTPHMPLSLSGMKEIKAAAKELGLPVDFVVDPHAHRRLATDTAKKLKLDASAIRKMESWELYNRNLVQHYPAMIVYSNGKVVSPVYAGFKPKETYVSFITKHLSKR